MIIFIPLDILFAVAFLTTFYLRHPRECLASTSWTLIDFLRFFFAHAFSPTGSFTNRTFNCLFAPCSGLLKLMVIYVYVFGIESFPDCCKYFKAFVLNSNASRLVPIVHSVWKTESVFKYTLFCCDGSFLTSI